MDLEEVQKVQTCVSNLTVDALKYTPRGSVKVIAPGLCAEGHAAIECCQRYWLWKSAREAREHLQRIRAGLLYSPQTRNEARVRCVSRNNGLL